MRSIILLALLFTWPAMAFHVGLNQNGVEFGNKWNSGLESNIYSYASFVHREKPVDNMFEIWAGVNGSIRALQAYSTGIKFGPAFEYRVLRFSGEISSEKDVFVEARPFCITIDYAANEKLSLTFDSAVFSLRFDRSFEYTGYYLGGIRPRLGIRYNI